jgi:hypothetical protein
MTKEFIDKMKQAIPHLEQNNIFNIKLMTEVAPNLCNVILEFETDNISNVGLIPALGKTKVLEDYLISVSEVKREIFWLE